MIYGVIDASKGYSPVSAMHINGRSIKEVYYYNGQSNEFIWPPASSTMYFIKIYMSELISDLYIDGAKIDEKYFIIDDTVKYFNYPFVLGTQLSIRGEDYRHRIVETSVVVNNEKIIFLNFESGQSEEGGGGTEEKKVISVSIADNEFYVGFAHNMDVLVGYNDGTSETVTDGDPFTITWDVDSRYFNKNTTTNVLTPIQVGTTNVSTTCIKKYTDGSTTTTKNIQSVTIKNPDPIPVKMEFNSLPDDGILTVDEKYLLDMKITRSDESVIYGIAMFTSGISAVFSPNNIVTKYTRGQFKVTTAIDALDITVKLKYTVGSSEYYIETNKRFKVENPV